MIYTHVMEKGAAGTRSPLDLLDDLNPDEVRSAVDASRRISGTAGVMEPNTW
jgi:hypothetical protein